MKNIKRDVVVTQEKHPEQKRSNAVIPLVLVVTAII